MHEIDALMIIEDQADHDYDTLVEAWQVLINSGLVWSLQGFYGRTAARLIEDGVCYDPEETNHACV